MLRIDHEKIPPHCHIERVVRSSVEVYKKKVKWLLCEIQIFVIFYNQFEQIISQLFTNLRMIKSIKLSNPSAF